MSMVQMARALRGTYVTPPSVSVAADDATVSVTQGATVTVTYTLTRNGSYTGVVTPVASGLSSGVSASFVPTTWTGATTAVVMTLTATAGATIVTNDAFTLTCSGSGVSDVTDNGTVTVATGGATYRGANLPGAITAPASLSASFGGMVWDYSDLYVLGTRYNAATRLTVSTTGSTGRTDFLAHLTTAAAGNADYVIILPTSAELSGGTYTLPAKTYTTKHCWIVADTVDAGTFGTARGTKIPAATTDMAILTGPNSSQNEVVGFANSAAACGYSFHGCVIQNYQSGSTADISLGLVSMRRTSTATTLADCQSKVYLDRCWIRGSTTTDTRRGIYAQGPYLTVHDSRITEVHVVGQEAAGIGGFTGSRYHDFRRLTIEAGSQAILYGGADPDQPNTGALDPADIFCDQIYAFKPLTWLTTHGSYAGTHWLVKTGFEAKNCRRWTIDRSWSQNCWPDAQTGYGMLFQNLSDNNTNLIENRVEDIVVRHHRFDYNANGLNILSRVGYHNGTMTASTSTISTLGGALDLTAGAYDGASLVTTSGTGSGQTRTISTWSGGTRQATVSSAWTTTPDATTVYRIDNGPVPTNVCSRLVFDNILATRTGGNRADATSIILNGLSQYLGYSFQLLSDINTLTIDRYTGDGERWINLSGSGGSTWSITNHVARQGEYGIFRDGGQTRSTAIASSCATALTFDGNVGYDLTSGSYSSGIDYNETNATMLFTDYAGYDYTLTSAHLTSGVSAGTPGCDIATLNTHLSGINT